MVHVFYQLNYISKDHAVSIADFFMNKWVFSKPNEEKKITELEEFTHKSPIILQLLEQISIHLKKCGDDLKTNKTLKHQFIKYLRFLEVFSFNSLNLIVANKAFASKVVMDIMLAFTNSKEDKTLSDHKESNE